MWTLESCNPIKLPSKKKRKKERNPANCILLNSSPPLLPPLFLLWQKWTAGLQIYHVQTVIIAGAACYWPKWIECHMKTHTRAQQQKGSWIRGVPGWGPCGRCVGDTKDRAGQCLNVTTLLFAVNYGWGQEYWLCNPAEQTFYCSQWRWQEKKRFNVCSCFVCFFLFFSSNQK